ncbi:RNA pyrophosphohydrolase [Rhodobacteraceae bacterium]|jgi:putative (di)nucleoside polyphosphate hydrolase|nr:RNA pyrophosphohydrolase [Paracoccaceae bacterium]
MNDFNDLNYRPCVGLMVVNKRKNFFTAQRLDFTSTAWQMPQGGIDGGEEALHAAYRELSEETSITENDVELLAVSRGWFSYDLPKELVSKLWNGLYRGQKQKWFLMRFTGNDDDINLNTEIPEFSCWRWSTRQQLIESIVPFKKDLYRAVLKEFQPLL